MNPIQPNPGMPELLAVLSLVALVVQIAVAGVILAAAICYLCDRRRLLAFVSRDESRDRLNID